ncbi:unnamed protein product [Bursaphelenchus xylophilus]|uniref:(pine wood nematode) hypothetical protein n=1 Tax=Bursaphelenchus xylophilus TaxID=6326 RepID=A0A1I7RJE7_BURXY|nr:unnamed protein product [Bursaphelenchus xylophilus]CAG9128832.1 unnamed protein product [Bursaphelenchus xylophilus]
MNSFYRLQQPSTSFTSAGTGCFESSDYANNNTGSSSSATFSTTTNSSRSTQKLYNTPNSDSSEFSTEQIYKPIGKKRYLRKELSKTPIWKLREIMEELEARADVANTDLVVLLMKRDQLYLEKDALQLEVEDILEFHKAKSVALAVNSKTVKGKCK